MASGTAEQLEELRRLATRYAIPLDLVDRLSLRPREVARSLGVSLRKVRSLIESGRLPACRVDEAVVVPVAAILRFLEANPYLPSQTKSVSIEDAATAFIEGSS